MSAWRIPLFDTRFGPEEEAAVLRPLRAGWLTSWRITISRIGSSSTGINGFGST